MTLEFALGAVGVTAIGALASAAATGALIPVLRRREVLDHPNPRSSHREATPRGGGLAVVGCLLPLWAVITLLSETQAVGPWLVLGGALLLGLISWIDDLRDLPALPRFAAQVAAVTFGIVALSQRGLIFGGFLPNWLDFGLTAVCWLWFLNLFNFMDGIDGITATETASVGIGLFIVLSIAGSISNLALPALAMAGTALGFLYWNWHPAKVFLGDVGSIPLGYLLGWLLLAAAADGFWHVALILPLYYLADASLTLLRRVATGAAIWQAHRTHFYQRATQGGLSHAAVVRVILAGNLGLMVLAMIAGWNGQAGGWSWLWTLLVAGALVGAMLVYFATRTGPPP